jgi:Ca2+-binding EF-hand superfamily protein
MNHKKSRLTDLFRKMDKNNDNLIPREDFIDGILKTSKFALAGFNTALARHLCNSMRV